MENNQSAPKKKPLYKRWWVWVGGIIVLFIIIGASSGGSSTNKTASTESKSTAESTKPAESGKQYVEVFKFSGNGAKKSEPFTITGNRFKIAYDCKGDTSATLCQAFAYKVGSNLPSGAIMNSGSAIKDETILYGKGEYYIDANSIANYTMTVYDYR